MLNFPPYSRTFVSLTGRRNLDGFTLLEVLVVMALIALIAGIALPNLARLLESYENSVRWAELSAEIDSLPYRAYSQSHALVLDKESAPVVLSTLPAGWKVDIAKPIRYRENGWCEGGDLSIISASGESRTLHLVAPTCASTP